MGRVLIVDDDETIRMLLNAHLRQTGHRVLITGSGDEAMAAVRDHGRPDVAVLDVSLPDIDGFDLAQKLRSVVGLDQLPIIFLSANVEASHVDRGRELGAVYLTKPYVRNALVNAIDKAITAPDGW